MLDDEIDGCHFRLSSFLYDWNGGTFLYVNRIIRVIYYQISKFKYISTPSYINENHVTYNLINFCFF